MPTLGVSEFSIIVVASGSPKTTKIRSLAKREPYAFFKDYYGSLRMAIRSLFTQKKHISYLYSVCRKQKLPNKKTNYEKIVNNFNGWQSGKNINAFTPPKEFYKYSNTSINCNPELHVILEGKPRLVKLHFSSSEKMTQERANIICALIKEAIDDDGFEHSVLDLTTGKEYFFNSDYEKVIFRINKEIENLEIVWKDYI